MSKTLLLTRARHNPHNEYLYAYSKEILDAAAAEGWDAHKAEDENATHAHVASRLSRNCYNLLVLNGHGEENLIMGYNDEVMLNEEDAALFKGTIAFFRSCDTLSGLGRAAVDNGGARATVGYAGAFGFYGMNGYASRPMQDRLANPVLAVSNIVATKLVEGSTVQDAIRASRREAKDRVRKLLGHTADQYNRLVIDMLVQNAIALDCNGDASAKA